MSQRPVVYADGRTLSAQEVAMVAKGQADVAVSDDAWPGIHAVSYTHLTLPTIE